MRGVFKPILTLFVVLLVAGCAGTGTKDSSQINSLIANADGNATIVARRTGFAGSGPRIFVLMDGKQVASLGSNEVGNFQASPGKHTLEIKFEGPSVGLKTNKLTYVNDPSRPQYFAITLTQQFLGAKMTIAEVPLQSFAEYLK